MKYNEDDAGRESSWSTCNYGTDGNDDDNDGGNTSTSKKAMMTEMMMMMMMMMMTLMMMVVTMMMMMMMVVVVVVMMITMIVMMAPPSLFCHPKPLRQETTFRVKFSIMLFYQFLGLFFKVWIIQPLLHIILQNDELIMPLGGDTVAFCPFHCAIAFQGLNQRLECRKVAELQSTGSCLLIHCIWDALHQITATVVEA